MNEGPTTWGLVVGIDKYDAPTVRQLDGAVADAVVAVQWLRRLGVPDTQIRLHAAPSAANENVLKHLGIASKPARNPDIWLSISDLRQQTGTRLFIFLFGHGLYDPSTRRLFLTQEAGVGGAWTNMGMELYVELFLSMSFSRQFLFFDGCLNKPYSDRERPVVVASMYPGVAGFTGDRATRTLVGCFAASMDQQAAEIGGRGAFSRRLFDALDPDNPYVKAVDYDFTTGIRTLNIGSVMKSVISSVQADTNALTPPLTQIPQLEIQGKGQSEPSVAIYQLEDIPTTQLRLDIQPPAALPDVSLVRVEVYDNPLWSLPLQPPPQVNVPLLARMPKDQRAVAECRVNPLAPWDATQARQEFTANTDHDFTLSLTPVPPDKAPDPPRMDGFSIKLTGPDGGRQGPLSGAHYHEAGRRLGLGASPAPGLEVSPGVVITPHEDGPDFTVGAGVNDAPDIASSWAIAIRDVVSPEITVSTVFRGNAIPPPKPNLRMTLSPGGASQLAGLLADRPVVTLKSPGVAQSMSPNQIEADPVVHVDPGPVQVAVDLPWGSWTDVTRVPTIGEATIELPSSVGRPPLRVRLANELRRMGDLILGVEGERPRGSVRGGLVSDRSRPMVEAPAGSAAWALAPSAETPTQTARTEIAVLVGSDPIAFPLSGRPMAVDRSMGGLRVEPLSDTPREEWDLLVATGRLDVVPAKQAVVIALEPSNDGILPLAAAYAVFSGQAWNDLHEVLLSHAHTNGPSLDLDLLSIAVTHTRGDRLSNKSRWALHGWAERGAVPFFRWGLPIVLDQLADADDEPVLRRWRSALEAVQRGLSPSSTWTAWTGADKG